MFQRNLSKMPHIHDSLHFSYRTFTLEQNMFMSLFSSMYSIVQNFGQFIKATYKITISKHEIKCILKRSHLVGNYIKKQKFLKQTQALKNTFWHTSGQHTLNMCGFLFFSSLCESIPQWKSNHSKANKTGFNMCR